MSMKNISQERKDMINISRRCFMVGSVKTSLFMAFGAAAVPSLLSAKESIEAKQFSPNIWFEMDTDGLISVIAKDLDTGMTQQTRIKISAGYSDDHIDQMKSRLESNAGVEIIHAHPPAHT